MLLNLILNAVQAMPEESPDPHGDCGSRAEPEGPEVQLTVTDTGIGIPLGGPVPVFDPFFTTKDEGRGWAGHRHALVEAHHGRIDDGEQSWPWHRFVATLPQSQIN